MFAKVITLIALIYTVLAVALMRWADKVALPTRGGISPSEIIEGIIPGGVNTVVYLWFAFLFLTAWAWFGSGIRNGVDKHGNIKNRTL